VSEARETFRVALALGGTAAARESELRQARTLLPQPPFSRVDGVPHTHFRVVSSGDVMYDVEGRIRAVSLSHAPLLSFDEKLHGISCGSSWRRTWW